MIDKTDIRVINEFSANIRLIKLRLALRQLGLFETVDTAIRNLGNPYILEWWEYGDYVDFLSDRMLQLKEALCISDEQYRQIYYLAQTIDIDDM